MNRERAKELAPVIKAFGDGEDIQWRRGVSCSWAVSAPGSMPSGLNFNCPDTEFRIKPKPIVYYVNILHGGGVISYMTVDDAKHAAGPFRDGYISVGLRQELVL